MFDLRIEDKDFFQAIRELEADNAKKMLLVLETVGLDTVVYLRSLTGEMRPPVRKGEPPRRAHPGHWADISSNLANAYRFEIWAGSQKVRWMNEGREVSVAGAIVNTKDLKGPYTLMMINDMEYAAYLEAREGYFVLSGVTNPGGPLEKALRRVVRQIPGWRLER